MVEFWIIALILFAAAEAATVSLVSVWFAVGSAAALIAAAFDAELWLQVSLFLVVSVAVLALLRPFARKYLTPGKSATNADRVIGTVCPVTEEIDNINASGAVSVHGKTWTARALSGEKIPAGTLVRPVRIEGVKLIVEVAEEKAAIK